MDAELREKRDSLGRFIKGVSGNPGGVPKAALELRKAFLEYAPEAVEKAVQLMRSDSPMASDLGVGHILNRALGRPGPPAELPDGMPAIEPSDTSPPALLSLAKRGFACVLEVLVRRQASGQPLSPAEVEQMGEVSRCLMALAKEERELAKQGPGASLSDAALVAEVLKAVPLDVLREALSAREKEAA